MALPPLVHYATTAEYRTHYEQIYCRGNLLTFDGIRVHFSPGKFGHMFYESTARNGIRNVACRCTKTRQARVPRRGSRCGVPDPRAA